MRFDWDIKKDNDFCLDIVKCELKAPNIKNLCFSFNKGYRVLIYVKK